MFSCRQAKKFCKNFELIENYDDALSSSEMYVIHHRLEQVFTKEELKRANWYYNRKPQELIFLKRSEHNNNTKIHVGCRLGVKKASESKKGKPSGMKGKTPWNKGIKVESASIKMKGNKNGIGNKGQKGKHWYTDGSICICAFECPNGFVPGRKITWQTRP